jgi:hypothetical protein
LFRALLRHGIGIRYPCAGVSDTQLKFDGELGRDGKTSRDYFAVLLRNHDISCTPGLNPRIAIVGLSPASTQIGEFRDEYKVTKDYAAASIAGAFAGLHKNIIAMLKGLGIAEKLNIEFLPNPNSLAKNPDIFGTSLVACASLRSDGNTRDFKVANFPAACRCITKRFVDEILNSDFKRLSHIFILGVEGWNAVNLLKMVGDITVLEHLQKHGKTVIMLPHPAGGNGEYIKLASFAARDMPDVKSYQEKMWQEYLIGKTKSGKPPEPEAIYKHRRKTIWENVDRLREDIARWAQPQ